MLKGSLYSPDVAYAAIVDPQGVVIAHNDQSRNGMRADGPADDLESLVAHGPVAQIRRHLHAGRGHRRSKSGRRCC